MCHITPVLKMLHWLPVAKRIEYKILFYTYKALDGKAPGYIRDLLTPYVPSRALRSDAKKLLCVPKSRTVTYSKHSFKNMAPVLWNALPYEVRASPSVGTFKKRLKTFIFKTYFV